MIFIHHSKLYSLRTEDATCYLVFYWLAGQHVLIITVYSSNTLADNCSVQQITGSNTS